jgi:segregation and condensation protein B
VRWQFRRHQKPVNSQTVAAAGQGVRSEKLARLEAALFVADGPLSTRKLSQFALLADTTEVRELIDELNRAYEQDGSAFSVERVASGYQLLTHPRYANWLDQLHQRTAELKLSSPAMETLTIVAYRQPITRAAIEAVRGVQCSEIIKVLMERNLIRIGGEEDTLGRPYLYVTTRTFLELFGLRTLEDLPDAKTLRVRPEDSSESEEEESLPEDEQASDDIAA